MDGPLHFFPKPIVWLCKPTSILTLLTFLFIVFRIYLLIVTPQINIWGAHAFANDFLSYYLGAILWRTQQNLYDVTQLVALKDTLGLQFLVGQGFVYPMFLAFFIAPLTFLPVLTAVRTWYLINVIIYAALGYFLGKKLTSLKPGTFFLVMFIFFTFPPLFGNFGSGQINILIFALYFTYLWSIEKQKPWLGGIFLSIATFLKVYPAAFLLCALLKKRMRIVAGFLLSVPLLVGIPLIFNSFDHFFYYFKNILPAIQSDADPYFTNQSVNAFLSRIFYSSDYSLPLLSVDINTFKVITWGVILFSVGVIVFSTFCCRHDPKKTVMLELVWLGTIVLVSGKSNFWTFVPTVLITLFLIIRFTFLLTWQKGLAVISLFLLYYQALFFGLTDKLMRLWWQVPHLGFLYLSAGFLGLLFEVVILISLIVKRPPREMGSRFF